MDSVWSGLCLILVINIWESSAITNKDNRRSKAPEEAVRHFRHIENPTTYTNIDWEVGLRESANQALLREKYHAPNLRDRLLRAPLIGKQDFATPFGDVAIVARGQLYVSSDGDFVFVQDAYQNDCEGCHRTRRRCSRCEQVFKSPQDEHLVALWTVKRLRHRDLDHQYRYETEYTISPIGTSAHGIYLPNNHHYDYAVPGHVFVIKHNVETSPPVTPQIVYNQRLPHTHFRPDVLIGIGAEGQKHFLHSYPGFYTTIPVHPTDQSTIDPKEIELYKALLEALASKTTTTQKIEDGPHRFSLNNYGNSLYTTEDSFTPLVQLPSGEMVPLTDVTFSATSTPQVTNGPVRFPETYPQEKVTKPQLVPDFSTTEVAQSAQTTQHVSEVTQPITTVHYFAPAEEGHLVIQESPNVVPSTHMIEKDGADFLFPIEKTTATPQTTKGYKPSATTTKFITTNAVEKKTEEDLFPEQSPSPTRQSKVYHANFSAEKTSFSPPKPTTPTSPASKPTTMSSTYKTTPPATVSETTPTTKETYTSSATFTTTPTTTSTTKTSFQATTLKTTPYIEQLLTTSMKTTAYSPTTIKISPVTKSIFRTSPTPKFATPRTSMFRITPSTTRFTVPITTARGVLPPVKINTTIGPTEMDMDRMSILLKMIQPSPESNTTGPEFPPMPVIFESPSTLTTTGQNLYTTANETEVTPTSMTTPKTTPRTPKTTPPTPMVTTVTTTTLKVTPPMQKINESTSDLEDNRSTLETTPTTQKFNESVDEFDNKTASTALNTVMTTELATSEATMMTSTLKTITSSEIQGDQTETTQVQTSTEATAKPQYKVTDQLQPPANETHTTAEFSQSTVTPTETETTTISATEYPTFKTIMTSTTTETTEAATEVKTTPTKATTEETTPSTKETTPTKATTEETTSITKEASTLTDTTTTAASILKSIIDDFLYDGENTEKSSSKKPTKVNFSEDDIFGSKEEVSKPTMATTMKITESEFAGELFGNRRRSPKMYVTEPSQTKGTKIIFSDFYEASTTSMKNENDETSMKIEDDDSEKIDPMTSQSYATSISFKVNKKTKKVVDDNGKTTLPTETNSGRLEESNVEASTMSAKERQETRKAFDEAALQLVNHVRSINYLTAEKNSTARTKYKRRRTYIPKSKRRKPKEDN